MKVVYLIGSLVFSGLAIAPIAKSQTYVLDFSDKDTFDVVFESGLRPKRTKGLESFAAEVHDVQVELVFGQGERYYIDAEMAKFYVKKDDLLGGVGLISPKLTVDEARELASPIVEKLGGSVDGLNAFLDEVVRNPVAFRADQFAAKKEVEEGVSVGLAFRNTFLRDKPLVAEFGVTWLYSFGKGLVLREPIPPPRGWEHVSLDPDEPGDSSVNNAVPSAGVADLQRAGSKHLDGPLAGGRSANTVLRPRWAYAVAGAGFLMLIVLGLYAYRKWNR